MGGGVVSVEVPRVLHVLGSLDMGGAETMVVTVAEALGARCDTHVLVFGDEVGALEERARGAGVTVHRMPAPRDLGAVRFVRALSALLRRERFDVVHSHVNLASGVTLAAARRAGTPVRVAHSHTTRDGAESWRRRAYGRLSRTAILVSANRLAACGEEAGEHLFGRAWRRRGGVTVQNGVDPSRFVRAREARALVRADLGLADDLVVIGAVARLAEVKNHRFLLEALAAGGDEGDSVRCVLVGDGPLRAELEDLAATLGVADRVVFLGVRDDVPRLLGALDLLAMPSLHEGVPVTLVEAQAAGIPALVSDQVGREADLGLGLIRWLPINEPATWWRAMRTRPDEAPSAETIGVALRESGYTGDAAAERLLGLYRDAMEQVQSRG
jgi:glycosyltransferase involved in cell wall biosynthesis